MKRLFFAVLFAAYVLAIHACYVAPKQGCPQPKEAKHGKVKFPKKGKL